MPVHYPKREDLKESIAAIEASGEHISSIVPDGDNHYLVSTWVSDAENRAPGKPEKRPAQ